MTSIADTLATAACIAGLFLPAFAQSPTPPPAAAAFEVADVHPSPTRLHPEMRGGITHGDRFFLKDATVIDLIANTYEVDPSSIFGGPSWLAFTRFDIVAKAPAASSDENAKLMVRNLLADRFKLVVHTGTRPLPAFVLSAGKTPKLKQSADSSTPGGCQYQQPPKDAPAATAMNLRFSCHNTTMEMLADFLHDVASPYLTRPVVDATGLKGAWDFELQWTYQIPKDTDGVTIFTAVDKQLGLKLEQKPAPLPVVAIDSISEPTPNRPDLDKVLPPPPPAEFEVAVIRPVNPEEKNFRINIEGNNISVQHASLLTLIYRSFDIEPGKIVNQPKWLNSDLWDITGKASADANAGPPIPDRRVDVDLEDVKEMLRSLLADRFKLTTHMDSRPAEVYALVAAGPKMKKADPTTHPACQEGPGPDGKDPRIDNPLLNRLVSCQNMTMAALAAQLRNLAGGYVPAPVIDATGLEGAFDFTLSFSKKADLNKGSPSASGGDPSGAPAASDPTLGGLTLNDALQKQLGLKLEKRDKVPVPILVIDHVEEQPTEN